MYYLAGRVIYMDELHDLLAAIHDLRPDLAKQLGDPSWLAYSVYGHLNARLRVPAHDI